MTTTASQVRTVAPNGNGHKPPAPDTDPLRLAPHSIEAEEAVLGACIMDGNGTVRRLSWLKADEFFIVRHGWVWDAIRKVADSDGAVMELTVVEALRAARQLDDVGGPAYIAHLCNNTATALYADVYAELVHRAAVRRRILGAAGEIAQLAHSETLDIEQVVTNARKTLDAAVLAYTARGGYVTTQDVVSAMFDTMGQGTLLCVPVGYGNLNTILEGGIYGGQLVYLAARPGMGKSLVLLTIALYVAEVLQKGVVYNTYEMTKQSCLYRLVSMKTGLSVGQVRRAHVYGNTPDSPLVSQVLGQLMNLPIYWSETSRTPDLLRAELDALTRRHEVVLNIGDHTQLMRTGDAGVDKNDYARTTYVSRRLKELTNESGLANLWAVQLSRSVEGRADKRPMLSDARDTGAIEEDADVLMALYRDDYYNPDSASKGITEVLTLKNRDGEGGRGSCALLYFDGAKMRLTEQKPKTILTQAERLKQAIHPPAPAEDPEAA